MRIVQSFGIRFGKHLSTSMIDGNSTMSDDNHLSDCRTNQYRYLMRPFKELPVGQCAHHPSGFVFLKQVLAHFSHSSIPIRRLLNRHHRNRFNRFPSIKPSHRIASNYNEVNCRKKRKWCLPLHEFKQNQRKNTHTHTNSFIRRINEMKHFIMLSCYVGLCFEWCLLCAGAILM